ncbi:MAG: TetR/AcrR family transcriptional regulator [Deltaproteobacteria bacterium]|nr:TetR/AcrR family transcriptional regulator [Deltaproteobacteria bacterium]
MPHSGSRRKDIPTFVKDQALVEKRRRQIVEAAVELFVRQGFHQTTTREIARAAGFSIGTLYEYIKSKEDVLYLVCDTIHTAMENQLRAALGAHGAGREALRAAMENYFKVCDAMQDHILLIYQELRALEPESLKFVLANEERITSIFEDILQLGALDGSLFPGSEQLIRLTAHNIVVLGHMWTFRRWSLSRHFSLSDYTQFQISFIINELSKSSDRGN